MNNIKKNQVLQVLNYWKIVEFLGQSDIHKNGLDAIESFNKENEENLIVKKFGGKEKDGKIEVFFNLSSFDDEKYIIDIEKLVSSGIAKHPDYTENAEEVQFCIGKIERNAVVEYLQRFYKDENPELNYLKQSAIAWFSFKSDLKGQYLQNSFSLSPILWAISVWEKSKSGGNFYLNISEYDELIKAIDNKLQDENVADFFDDLYGEIRCNFVNQAFLNPQTNTAILQVKSIPKGFAVYSLYKNEEELSYDENPTDYTDLGKSFYLNDISLLIKLVETNQFGDKNAYEKMLVEYILSNYNKSKDIILTDRIDISTKQSCEQMKAFFEKTLDVKNAPMGKWPAKFMPALMQQVAVNLAITNDDKTAIFSVNGPPGTGKTTLLKEIVASNIVDRAFLLASSDEPDDLFEKHFFKKGPLEAQNNAYYKFAPAYYSLKNDTINNYGMLVASCNNTAVENITKDLPKANDILNSLKTDDEIGEIKRGLDEIHALFDINKTDEMCVLFDIDKTEYTETIKECNKEEKEIKDIYFTRYAEKLLESKECWGLISAPFGKRKNIKHYADKVLKSYLNDYKSNAIKDEHKEKYKKIKEKFIKQYRYVEKLREELEKNYKSANPNSQIYLADEKKFTLIDDNFMKNYYSEDEKMVTKAQTTNPYFTPQYNRAREKLFLYACKLHKEFIISSKCMKQNIINLLIAWNLHDECSERMQQSDKELAMPYLLQSVFLLTPVISTTFASAQKLLGDVVRSGIIGTLIVDEAGQAQPQEAIGTMFRCKKAIIVGDPKQIEPVVTAETDMIKHLMNSEFLSSYKDKRLSVQGFADYINPYGTFLGEDEEKEWVGCPLVVHRRCIEPMYSISNILSYDGTMKQQTSEPGKEQVEKFILEQSCWINVRGQENSGNKDHFVKAQGEIVLDLLKEKLIKNNGEMKNLFIITPFTSVKNGIKDMIEKSPIYSENVKNWLKDDNIGTVHTFQGKGTDEVIFLLGCDTKSTTAANWVNKNIVNVAATRAKFRFYMIGDKDVWTCKPIKTAREIINNIIDNEESTDDICPQCGKTLVPRKGKFGEFYGCSGFKDGCRYTRSKHP